MFFLSAGTTCITLHPCDRCRRLCITSKVFRSCLKPRRFHAFLHWYAKRLQLDTLSSSFCVFTCSQKSGMNICVLCLLAGPSVRLSVCPSVSQSVCVCSPVSQCHLFSQSACLSAHPSVSVSQSVIDYTSHMWFLFPLYVHIPLSFANKHVYIDVFFFFAVYKFFEQRNVRLRGNPDFAPGAKFVFIFIKSIFCLLLVVLLMLVLHENIKRIT